MSIQKVLALSATGAQGRLAAQRYQQIFDDPSAHAFDIDLRPVLERRPATLMSLETWGARHANAFGGAVS